MKKGKLKKILATGAMGIMALAMPFALTGCDKNSDINVRVEGDYIQWQVDGSDSWTNLLSVEEVKDLLGESYKGDTGAQGNPGINGKEVEFRTNDTHIQWRYVDNSQGEDENWEDLVLVSSLKGDKGDTGQNGSNGIDGKTPFIGTNGNWWIGEIDTGVKAEGEDGHTPTIEISSDGYWIIDDEKTEYKAVGEDGQDSTYTNYTIKFDYGLLKDYFYRNVDSVVLKSTQWITDLPIVKADYEDVFEGWFVQGTNKEISNYDFVGGDVTLDARFNVEKLGYSGLYQQGKYVMTWNDIKEKYPDAVTDTAINKVGPGASAFRFLSGELVIDNEILHINDSAFWGCKGFTCIILPSRLNKIGDYAFSGCSDLTTITIPQTVMTIGDSAFSGCLNIQSIYYNAYFADNIQSSSPFGDIGSNSKNVIVYIGNTVRKIPNFLFESYMSESYIKDIIFEENSICESIGKYAFEHCRNLTSLGIPQSVKKISEGAFHGCLNLNSVTILNSNITIEESVFAGNSKLLQVIIDNEAIANSLISNDVFGSLILYAEKIYIRQELTTQESTYLVANYDKQIISDKIGYNLWTKKAGE